MSPKGGEFNGSLQHTRQTSQLALDIAMSAFVRIAAVQSPNIAVLSANDRFREATDSNTSYANVFFGPEAPIESHRTKVRNVRKAVIRVSLQPSTRPNGRIEPLAAIGRSERMAGHGPLRSFTGDSHFCDAACKAAVRTGA